MATRDPYKVLGLDKSASAAELKSAYRKLAKKHHPDANKDDPNAQSRFAELNAAYELLSDKDKRGQFDRGEIDADGNPRFAGFDPRGGGFGGGAGGPGGGRTFTWRTSRGGGGGEFDAGDAFADILNAFGAGRRGGAGGFAGGGDPMGGVRAQKVADVKAEATLSLEDLESGNKARVLLPDGRTLDINIPAGTRSGTELRLKGQGATDPLSGRRGDVRLTVKIAPHKNFRVDGDDLRLDQPVPLADAVLGGKVRIRTLSGQADIAVPKGTSSGRTMRLKGKGLAKKGGGHGDLLVTLQIQLPEPADPELEALMEKSRAAMAGDTRG
ncbi:MAG: J domain-containing protein [Rhodobiaceae bacterium]|nr:J domain-containing protein [Rhodobiaceae bacterium]